jgi:hypothetical protein
MIADDDLTRADMQLIRQGLRSDWPIPPAVRAKIIQRLVDLVDREHPEGAAATPRTVIMACRVLADFAALNIKQQAVDLGLAKFESGGSEAGEMTLADCVAEAERLAEERERERERTP